LGQIENQAKVPQRENRALTSEKAKRLRNPHWHAACSMIYESSAMSGASNQQLPRQQQPYSGKDAAYGRPEIEPA
jgi:hypothetical protein